MTDNKTDRKVYCAKCRYLLLPNFCHDCPDYEGKDDHH